MDLVCQYQICGISTVALNDDEIAITGGEDGATRVKNQHCLILNVKTKSLYTQSDMKIARSYHTSCVYDKQLTVIGGSYEARCETLQNNDQWEEIRAMPQMLGVCNVFAVTSK